MYNDKFNQCLEVVINAKDHGSCLEVAKVIKKQCEAWNFCVRYNEYKSTPKGPVLQRTLMIYQNAFASDIIIFKEAIRRICEHYRIFHKNVHFTDRGTEPENNLRQLA